MNTASSVVEIHWTWWVAMIISDVLRPILTTHVHARARLVWSCLVDRPSTTLYIQNLPASYWERFNTHLFNVFPMYILSSSPFVSLMKVLKALKKKKVQLIMKKVYQMVRKFCNTGRSRIGVAHHIYSNWGALYLPASTSSLMIDDLKIHHGTWLHI